MKYCNRCLIPETHETILFDLEGICNICRQQEKKGEIDWDAKKQELATLIDAHRNPNGYDCIVPFSGGKDSTFTLYHLVKEWRVRPLVVQFDHGFLRQGTLENNKKTLEKIGCEFLSFRPNWQVVRCLMLESLKRKGDFCWHCHTGIFSFPMQIGIKFGISLIIWGEKSSEYTSYYGMDEEEEVDEKRFNRYINLGITAEDMEGMIDVQPRELDPFRFPSSQALRSLGVRSICLGSFIPWDTKSQVEIIKKELGWKGDSVEGIPPEYDYEKIECSVQGVRDYIRYLKRGYGRTAHLTSIDIRNHRMPRGKALDLVNQYDGKRPASLDSFLEMVGISEVEFMDIVKTHEVSPWSL